MPPRQFYEYCNSSLRSHFIQELFIKTVNLVKHRVNPIWTIDSSIDQSYFYRRWGLKQEQALEVVNEAFDKAVELCELMGIPIMVGDRGEILSAIISTTRKNTYMATDTIDGLILTPEKLLIGLNKRHCTLNEVKLNIALSKLELTYNQFVDLCLLNEYISECNAITPMQGYNMIKEYNSIENILKNSPEDIKNKLKDFDYSKKQKVEIDRHTISSFQINPLEIKWTKCDAKNLRTFLKTYELDKTTIETGIEILNEWMPYNSYAYQTRIEHYFCEKKKVPGVKLIKEKTIPLKQTKISQFFEVKYV